MESTQATIHPDPSAIPGRAGVKSSHGESLYSRVLWQIRLKEISGMLMLALGDVTAVLMAGVLAYYVRVTLMPLIWMGLPRFSAMQMFGSLWWLPDVYVMFFMFRGLYVQRVPFWQELSSVLKAITYSIILCLAILTLSKMGNEISRSFVVLIWVFSSITVPGLRYLVKTVMYKGGIWTRPLLVIGNNEAVANVFSNHPEMGYKVVGQISEDGSAFVSSPICGRHLGSGSVFDSTPTLLSRLATAYGVRDFAVAIPGLQPSQMVEIARRLQPFSSHIFLVPEILGPVSTAEVDSMSFLDDRKILVRARNNLNQIRHRVLKRSFDIVVSSALLLGLSPILLGIALVIWIEDRGEVLFRHRRIGRGGVSFGCLKFRTMVADGDGVLQQWFLDNPSARKEWLQDQKLRNDPRITKVGKLLRKLSLDELPQLWNVLVGEMSLVGPRPIVEGEVERYGTSLAEYHGVRPGLTGLWQVSGRNNIDYSTRVQMDSWYVKNWSLWLDITLMLRTIPALVRRKGAY